MSGLLTQRATLRFGLEATQGQNPGLASGDAILIEAPAFTPNVNKLERKFTAKDLSPYEHRVGRILSGFEFTCVVGGNGTVQSGLQADVPKLAQLIQACGYNLTLMTGAGTTNNAGPVVPNYDNPASPVVAWATTATAVTITKPVLLTLTCVLGGASGVATISVTSNDTTAQANIAATAVTSGTPFALGGCGTLTPTWAGNLVAGQKWTVAVFPKGCMLTPMSSNMKTGSLELNLDGVKHEGNAGMGTWVLDAQAGEYATIKFMFTASYVDAVDAALPTDDPQLPNPPMVELANFTFADNQTLMVDKVTLDAGNSIQPRPSVNSSKGFFGSRITSRVPAGSFDPEQENEGTIPMWADFTKSKSRALFLKVGTDIGNTVVFYVPKAQTADQKYGDRNGIRTLDKSFDAKRVSGDDEVVIVFC